MKKKLIIFDLDGVLFDTCKLVDEFFMSVYPTMTREIMDTILEGNFPEGIAKFKENNTPVYKSEEERHLYNEEFSKKKARAPLFPGMKELIENLHKNQCLLAINTSASEKNCVPLLEYTGIRHYFDFVATKETSISKIEKFKIIVEKYKLSKNEMLFITDTVGDIVEAQAADIPTIAVTWGAHPRSTLEKESYKNIVAIIDSADELAKFL